ncbi:MAG: NAD-dependent epimerase/dehydratase family protein [Planctomycetota bacterium]|jgi:UDP-glucose 4-epimerase
MQSVLITGGAGFIGSHLTESLLAEGDEVYVLDDLSTGAISNLDAVRGRPGLHVHLDSMNNEPLLMELVDRADAVYHLAAAVGVKLIVEDPVRTIETNIHATELLLRHCAKKRRKVLLASSSEVYGKGQRAQFSEEDDLVLGPTTKSRWSYGCSKAIDEFLGLAYWKEYQLPVVIARFFNIVGPRQVGHYGMVVPRFVQQALDGGPITIYDDGEQVRCFAHVSDVVRAMRSLMDCDETVGQIFNVGDDRPTTINELAQKVRELVNPEAEIVHIPYAEAYAEGFEDIRFRVPDIGKLKEAIGFRPQHDLERILLDVRDHLASRGGADGPSGD